MTMYHTTNYESSLTALPLHNSLIKHTSGFGPVGNVIGLVESINGMVFL
jgi:hypothetical protein